MAALLLRLIALAVVALHAGTAASAAPVHVGRKLKGNDIFKPIYNAWHGDGPKMPPAPVVRTPSSGTTSGSTRNQPKVTREQIKKDCRDRTTDGCRQDVARYEAAAFCPGQMMCCNDGTGYTAYAGDVKGSGMDVKAACRSMKCKKSC